MKKNNFEKKFVRIKRDVKMIITHTKLYSFIIRVWQQKFINAFISFSSN